MALSRLDGRGDARALGLLDRPRLGAQVGADESGAPSGSSAHPPRARANCLYACNTKCSIDIGATLQVPAELTLGNGNGLRQFCEAAQVEADLDCLDLSVELS